MQALWITHTPPNNESVAGTTPVCDVAPITRREDYILNSNYHSTDKTPAEEDASSKTNLKRPQSSTQFQIHVEANQQGVVVLHVGLVPYMKNGPMSSTQSSTGLIMRIFFKETTSVYFLPLPRTILKISLID